MRIFDPLYGRFEVPDYVAELLSTPEVRRLSNVRLINALSPSLATLGEIRRYSHTIGVVYLASTNSFMGYGAETVRAFLAAVLLHDVGTPPFGHLFEYQLRDRFSWHHEDVIGKVIEGRDRPEASAHQIFGGRAIKFLHTCRRLHIDTDLLLSLVSQTHPLSKLIFGTLDFDNLDNVLRMSWALGLTRDVTATKSIASALCVGQQGVLQLPITMKPAVGEWLALRRRVYDILVFDGPTVAAQAVLSKSIAAALDSGLLTAKDWDRHDEDLIELLRKSSPNKSEIILHYLGKLPDLSICMQVFGSLRDLGFSRLEDAKSVLDEILAGEFLSYVFLDHGTFEKALNFTDPQSNDRWSIGNASESLVLYAFKGKQRPRNHKPLSHFKQAIIERFSPRANRVAVHA
jgi:HD superfamily phosphohydrolase